MSEPVSKARSVLMSVATRNIYIEVEFGGTIVVLVLDVMEQVSECVCDDAGVSRLPQCQLIQLDQVILSAIVLCPPRVSSATGARRRKRYFVCSCMSSELVHIETVSVARVEQRCIGKTTAIDDQI